MSDHRKQWRIDQVGYISDLIAKYNVIGIGDLNSYPSALLHKLRKNLGEDVVFKVTNRNVLVRVLKQLKQDDIVEKLPSQPILILSNKDAFELYNEIKKNKQKYKAKEGMLAPEDIIIPKGDTGLPPGPALSDLKKVGLKVQVKGATISIVKDKVITKAGDPIGLDAVSILSKLGIKPVELMLNVVGIKQDGIIYSKDVLDVDADTIFNEFTIAVRNAVNLAVDIAYVSDITIEPILIMAELKAKALQTEVDEKSTSEETPKPKAEPKVEEKNEEKE